MKMSLARVRMVGLSCVAFLVVFGLGACGSGGGSHRGSSGQASGASADSPSAVASLAALLPARIAKSKTLVVGIMSAGASSMETTSGSKIVGFDPDLIKAIGRELGVKVEVRPGAFDSLVAGVQAGRYDVTIGGMGDTEERQQSVSFVDYLNIGLAIVVKKGNPAKIQGANDLCGKALAALTGGYPQEVMVPKLSGECTKAGESAIHALSFSDVSFAVLAVQSGRADCLYDDSAAAAYLLKTTSGQFDQVGPSQTIARTGIAFAKTDGQLGSAIQRALQALMNSGEYATIANRWGLTGEMIPAASINKALL